MFATLVRRLAHKVNVQNPYLTKKPEELGTQKVLAIVREHGPLKVAECWEHAEKVGIKSKCHMKRLLHWLRDKRVIYSQCTHTSGDKKNNHDRDFKWAILYPKYGPEPKPKRRRRSVQESKRKAKLKAQLAALPPTAALPTAAPPTAAPTKAKASLPTAAPTPTATA